MNKLTVFAINLISSKWPYPVRPWWPWWSTWHCHGNTNRRFVFCEYFQSEIIIVFANNTAEIIGIPEFFHYFLGAIMKKEKICLIV